MLQLTASAAANSAGGCRATPRTRLLFSTQRAVACACTTRQCNHSDATQTRNNQYADYGFDGLLGYHVGCFVYTCVLLRICFNAGTSYVNGTAMKSLSTSGLRL